MARSRQTRRKLKIVRFVLVCGVAVLLAGGAFGLHKIQFKRHAGGFALRARAAQEVQDWPVAASMYRNYLKFQPNDLESLQQFAETLEELRKQAPEKIRELIEVYERLRKLDNLDESGRRKLTKHYAAIGNTAAARSNLEALFISSNALQDDVELLELGASLDEAERKVPQAIAGYRKAIATTKASADTYIRLAYMLRKEMPEAEGEAEAVVADLVRTRPNDVKARLVRADYRLRLGNTKQAKDDIEFAYRNIPGGNENLDVIQSLTALATAEGDYSTAKEILTAARTKLPDEIRLQVSLADVQIQMRDAEAAKATLLAAAAANKKADRILLDIADRLIDLGEIKVVADVSRRFAEADVKFAADYLDGRMKLVNGQWPDSIALLERAVDGGLERYPAHQLSALIHLADGYAQAGNVPERLRYLNRALKIDSRSPRALMGRAESLAATGQVPQALDIYRQLAAQSSAARAAWCQLLLAQTMNRPEAERNWALLENAYGPQPRPIEIEVVQATALAQQNKVGEAISLLEKTVARPEAALMTGPRVALAFVKAGRNPADGFAVLDAAEQTLGKRLDFLTARAVLLARVPNGDPAKIIALGDQSGTLKPDERYQLFAKLGAILAGLSQTKPAIEFYRKACIENARDATLRLNLFELAVQTDDVALQDRILQELEALEGAGGPSKLIAEITRDIRKLKPGQSEQIEALKLKLNEVVRKRDTWAPAAILQGDLELLAGRGDMALGHYRRAIDLGEESFGVVRVVVRLLLERQGQREALELLNRIARRSVLPNDLTKQFILLRSAYGENAEQTLAWARSPQALESKVARDHLMRAVVLETNGARVEARKSIEKAMSLDDSIPETWVNLVRLLVLEEKLTEAKSLTTEMQRKLQPKPNDADSAAAVILAVGSCWELIGETASAEERYKAALALQPVNAGIVAHVQRFHQRNGRSKEAEQLLEDLSRAAAAPTEVRRWARRLTAFNKVSSTPSIVEWNAAMELIDRNLQEGGNLLEDQRARALILAVDPFRQVEAIDLLTESAKTVPLTTGEHFYLSRMYQQQGRFDKAEASLKDATRMGATALPEHLAALARLQVQRGNTTAAAETVNRLKSSAGNTWETLCEEARVLAAIGKKEEAARKLLEWKASGEAGFALTRTAPFLEEIGLHDAAEALYRAAAKEKKPGAYLPLAGFLLRRGRAQDVSELAFQNEVSAPVGLTARLLAGAARAKPPAALPESERTAWAPTVQKIDDWIAKKIPQHPGNAELLFAKAELDDLNGRYNEELAAYDVLLGIDGDNPNMLNNYAMLVALHTRSGGDKALAPIQKAIARHGMKPTFLDTRAVVHTAGERYDEAIKDLNAAIGIDPKPGYFFHLAIVEERKAGERGTTGPRDQAFREALRRGLTKTMLHPKEWADYDRLKDQSR